MGKSQLYSLFKVGQQPITKWNLYIDLNSIFKMAVNDYNTKVKLLKQVITTNTKNLEGLSNTFKEQVSLDSRLFERYELLPDFEKITDKDYLNSLFRLRNLIGKDILVSDLEKLSNQRKNGMLESYLEDISQEAGNCSVCNRYNNSIEYFLPVKSEINKFYISSKRITFFSGASFYFEKRNGKFYEFQEIDKKEVKLGELILSAIAREELNIRFKI